MIETNEIKTITKTPRIEAPVGFWDYWDKWCQSHGCASFPEGFRAMVKQVTGWNPESQEKSVAGGI
jgi:hypothetical protein